MSLWGRVQMKKLLLFCILLSISVGFSVTLGRGELEGFFDYRYIWSEKVSAGTGTFQVSNLNLIYNFPLNKQYKVFLQTNISSGGNSEITNLYLDTETSLPLQMRLGRFSVETMERDKDQDESNFISNPIFWNLDWKVANNPLLPDNETGIMVYNTGRNHDLNFYLLNGANEWEETVTESKKAVGMYFRTLVKNTIEIRGSIYSNMFDYGKYNHTVLTGEAIIEMADIKLKGGALVLVGENNGVKDNGAGVLFSAILPLAHGSDLAAFASIFKNGQYYYRGAIALKTTLNQDMIWKNEFCMEKDGTQVKDMKIQSQIVVLL